MRGKLVLLVGVGIGYVLGARAGRERYEDIKRAACRFWNDPRVTDQRHSVGQFAKDKAPDVVDFIGDTAKKVIGRSSDKDATASSAASASDAPKTATAKKSTAKKSTAKKSTTPKPSTGSASSASSKK